MIFGTKNNQLAIFGQTLDDVREKLIAFDEVIMQGGSFGSNTLKLIPEEKLTQIISEEDASDIVTNLNSIKDKTNETYQSFDDYFKILKQHGQEYVADYVKTNQNQIYVTEDVVQASKNARAAQIAQNEAINASTLSAKAGAVAMKTFAVAANMLATLAITWAIGEIVKGINDLAHAAENARKASAELTDTYRQEKQTIDDSISKYKELKSQLQDNSLSTSEIKSIKEQLLSVQDELNDKYGAEATQIDLVNGKYDEQIKKLDTLAKKKAKNFVAENYNNNKEDQKYINETYGIGETIGKYQTDFNTGLPSYNVGFDLNKYLKKYKNLSLTFFDSTGAGVSGDVQLFGNGTREELYNQLSDLLNDLSNDFGESNESVNKFKSTISGILEDSFDPEELESAKARVKEYAESQILASDESATAYNNLIDAVDNYNKALESGVGVDKAEKKLLEAKDSAEQTSEEIANAGDVFKDVYNSISDSASIEIKVKLGTAGESKTEYEDLKQQLQDTLGFGSGINTLWAVDLDKKLQDLGLYKEDALEAFAVIKAKYVNGETESWTPDDWISNIQEELKQQEQNLDEMTVSLSVSDTIDQLNTQLKPAFDSLKSAYQDIFTKDGFTLDNVDISMLDSIKSKIDELNNNEELNIQIDYSSFDNLSKVLTDSSSTADEVQNAFNDFADTIVNSLNPALGQTTGENYKLVQSLLESVGIINSEAVMISSLGYSYEEYSAAKEECANAGFDLANATEEEISGFIAEQGGAENCGVALATLQLKKLLVNSSTINTSTDIQQILSLASAANISTNSLIALANAKAQFETASANGDKQGMALAARGIRETTAKVKEDILNFEPVKFEPPASGSKSGGGSSKDTKESFDWIERAIKNLESEISRLDKIASSSFSTLEEKNKALADQIGLVNQEIALQQQAYEGYMQKAESIGLSDEYKNLVQNGGINVEDITDKDLQEAIKNYKQWYDQAKETQDKINELREDAMQKHVQCYENETDELKGKLDTQSITEKQYIDQMLSAWKKYFDGQVEYAEIAKQKKLEILQEEKSYLQSVGSAALYLLDKQIEDLEDEKDNITKKYQNEIDILEKKKKPLEEQLDLMEKTRDKEDKILALQKAQYELARAMNQRDKLVYKDGQMVYTADDKSVKDKKSEVDDAEFELAKFKIQEQIDAYDRQIEKLNELIDETEKYYDDQIDKLQDYKDKWQEAIDLEELSVHTQNFIDKFGDGALSRLFSSDMALIDDYKTSYLNVLKEIDTTSNGTVGDIANRYAELANLDLTNLTEQLKNLSTSTKEIKDSADSANQSLSTMSTTASSVTTTAQTASDQLGTVTQKFNELTNEVSNYSIPALDTSNFASSLGIDGNGGVLGDLQLFIDKYKELCESIPKIWNDSLGTLVNGGGQVSGEERNYDALFQPLLEAMTSTKTAIDTKLEEYKTAWTDFNADLGGIIGVGGSTGDTESPITGTEQTGGKQQKSDKKKEDESDTSSIVGTITAGGEAVNQSFEEVWIPGFESFRDNIDRICSEVVACMNEMAKDAIEAAIKTIEAVNAANVATGGTQYEIPEDILNWGGVTYTTPYSKENSKRGKAYADGTNGLANDEKNALRSEYGQPELTVYPNGEYEVTNKPTMSDLPKGTVIYDEEQTHKILNNKGKSVSGKSFVDGTITLASGTTLTPIQPEDSGYKLVKIAEQLKSQMVDNMIPSFDLIGKNVEMITKNINSIQNRQQSMNIIENVNVNCPGITSDDVAKQIGSALRKEFSGMSLNAYQKMNVTR